METNHHPRQRRVDAFAQLPQVQARADDASVGNDKGSDGREGQEAVETLRQLIFT